MLIHHRYICLGGRPIHPPIIQEHHQGFYRDAGSQNAPQLLAHFFRDRIRLPQRPRIGDSVAQYQFVPFTKSNRPGAKNLTSFHCHRVDPGRSDNHVTGAVLRGGRRINRHSARLHTPDQLFRCRTWPSECRSSEVWSQSKQSNAAVNRDQDGDSQPKSRIQSLATDFLNQFHRPDQPQHECCTEPGLKFFAADKFDDFPGQISPGTNLKNLPHGPECSLGE